MSKRNTDSASPHKLPSGPSAKRRRFSDRNAWTENDKAELRRPLIVVAVVAVILLAGVVLMVSGL
jgi:hypothetical protein